VIVATGASLVPVIVTVTGGRADPVIVGNRHLIVMVRVWLAAEEIEGAIGPR